ncbi:hypothetical protein AGMMS49944_09030 [Spirochaetia bacterium]|nr:hypothetical protein AGMMS49944_09030 [Spirochaetia bacterium]
MANLSEDYQWQDGVHEWAEDEWIEGGPDGPDNIPGRQLSQRAQFLAVWSLYNGSLSGSASKEVHKTIRQRIQEGTITIYNRGIKAGGLITKQGTYRAVLASAATIFCKGVEMPWAGDGVGVIVPPNPGGAAVVHFTYLTIDVSQNIALNITPAGAVVPDGGIPLSRINVPAGNTAVDLTGVTITDVRRLEAAWPLLVNSLAYSSVALPFVMLDTNYSVHLDVAGYAGGWNQRDGVYAKEKAANGFKIYADGTLDEVIVQWKALKMVL